MTAIITKQNAKDGAFTGGGGGSPDKDSEFKNIHVHNDATVDGDIIMTSADPQSLTLRLADIDASVSSYNTQTMKFTDELNNHESRIKILVEKHDGDDGDFSFEDGLNDFIITSDKLTENLEPTKLVSTSDQPDLNSLSIKTDFGEYIGDVFEIELPSYMKLPKAIITKTSKENMFKNPIVNVTNNNYELVWQEDDVGAKIYMSNKKGDTPLNLYTSGFMKINYIAHQKTNVSCENNDSNQLINLKCNTIDADNCFKLYRSPLPDFYEMKSFGVIDDKSNPLYYADWGYVPGTPEFDSLIEGQTFEFHDEAFGTDYKMTKVGNEWVGNNYCCNIPLKLTRKNPGSHEVAFICIAKNETNKYVLHNLVGYDNQGNPFELLVNKGMLTPKDNCKIQTYKDDNDSWRVYIYPVKDFANCTYSATLNINNKSYDFIVDFEYKSSGLNNYKLQSDNYFELLEYHYTSPLQVGNPPYGLILYMPKDDELIYTIADVSYEKGMNTFEFLANTGYYTVSPRPEACTTLYTNFNIQTSGMS